MFWLYPVSAASAQSEQNVFINSAEVSSASASSSIFYLGRLLFHHAFPKEILAFIQVQVNRVESI